MTPRTSSKTKTEPDNVGEAVLAVRGMTCGSCVHHVRAALESVAGVARAEVDLDAGQARVRYDAGVVTVADLREAVRRSGYEAEDGAEDTPVAAKPAEQPSLPRSTLFWPILAGTLGAAMLAALYLTVVAVAQSWSHALELLAADWYFVAAIAAGFGTQVGLFVHLRRRRRASVTRSSTALSGAGTGTSTVALLACCAHHLGDVLPLLGLSGAAIFLTDNRVPFMVFGILSNVLGVILMLRLLRRQDGGACAVVAG